MLKMQTKIDKNNEKREDKSFMEAVSGFARTHEVR